MASFLPHHEMNERLDLIQAVRDMIVRSRPSRPPLNHIQFSYLMGMPLRELQLFSTRSTLLIPDVVDGLRKFTSWFLNSSDDRYSIPSPPLPAGTVHGGSPSRRGGQGSTRSQGASIRRTQTTIDECQRLDQYRCIVTGLANPQVCHIVPFAWNKTEQNLAKTEERLRAVADVIFERSVEANNTAIEILKGVKSSDKPWNVLCLSPQLHSWWGKAFFGFKYVGATVCEDDPKYSIISLQFVWMPCNVKAMAKEQVDLEAQRDPSTALGSYLNHRYGQGPLSACTTRNCTKCQETQAVKCHDISSNRPIESGTIIKVKRLTEHRGFFEHVIKLQWSVIRAAALSGGPFDDDSLSCESEKGSQQAVMKDCDAESWGYLSESEEEEEQGSIYKVEKWLDQLNPEGGGISEGSTSI